MSRRSLFADQRTAPRGTSWLLFPLLLICCSFHSISCCYYPVIGEPCLVLCGFSSSDQKKALPQPSCAIRRICRLVDDGSTTNLRVGEDVELIAAAR